MTLPRPRRPTLSRRLSFLTVVAVALLLPACGGGNTARDGVIERETFIATYVDLRLSALGTTTGVIEPSERSRILEKHGVTTDAMEAFAEAWGDDPAAMQAVWAEVQRRLRVAAGEDTTTHMAVPAQGQPD